MSLAGLRAGNVAVLLAACWLVLAACAGPGTPPESQPTASGKMPELLTLGETQPYLERIADGLGTITWASPYSGPTPEALDSGADAVRAAISASAPQLAAVDYVALALPDWVTVTRQLTLMPTAFTGQGAQATDVGSIDGKPRWLLYEWRGPEIPQRTDRRIVYRWVTVYALYDPSEGRVTRLLATIRGEAHE